MGAIYICIDWLIFSEVFNNVVGLLWTTTFYAWAYYSHSHHHHRHCHRQQLSLLILSQNKLPEICWLTPTALCLILITIRDIHYSGQVTLFLSTGSRPNDKGKVAWTLSFYYFHSIYRPCFVRIQRCLVFSIGTGTEVDWYITWQT